MSLAETVLAVWVTAISIMIGIVGGETAMRAALQAQLRLKALYLTQGMLDSESRLLALRQTPVATQDVVYGGVFYQVHFKETAVGTGLAQITVKTQYKVFGVDEYVSLSTMQLISA